MTPKVDFAAIRAKSEKRAKRAADLLALARAARGENGQIPETAPKTPPRSKTSRLTGGLKTSAKRKKSPSLSKLKKELWKEISLLVRSWSPVCIVPGCWEPTYCAAHIVPSHEGAATRFFLPNLYPCCGPHNDAERHRRASWVKKHEEMFGVDFVTALYDFAKTTFPLKKWWVREQIARVKKLREGGA